MQQETPPTDRELLELVLKRTTQTRNIFIWTLVLNLAFFILPLIGMLFAIPYLLRTYATLLDTSVLGI